MKKRILKLIWPFLYLILIFFVCGSGCLIFHSYYYRSIFVDGESMFPTLAGGTKNSDYLSNFGIIDAHEDAINKIERYNIVTTYYPWDEKDYSQEIEYEANTGRTPLETAYYKIKRVVGLPGDILKVKEGELYSLPKESYLYQRIYGLNEEELAAFKTEYGYQLFNDDLEKSFVHVELPFERHFGKNTAIKDTSFIMLLDDEYWVLGDNWGNSTDCGTSKKPIYKENIVGVLVAIEGTCKIKSGNSSDGNNNKTCEDRVYSKPVFFK